jgi:KRAB domain-containing zinc finger protein
LLFTSFTHFRQFKLSQCSICLERFSSTALLELHITFDHLNLGPLSLGETSLLNLSESNVEESFPNTKQKSEQIKKPVQQNKKQPIKKKMSTNKRYQPIIERPPSPSDPVVCHECGKFVQRRSLPLHMNVVHIKSSNFFCDLCGKGFFRKQRIMNHIVTHIPPELRVRDYVCDICSHAFVTEGNLKQHISYVHSGRNLKCECGKMFKNPVNLRNHKNYTHNKESLKRKCEQCGEVLNTGTLLKEHIEIFHTEGGRGNYVCSECGNHYDRKVSLLFHRRIHMKKTIPCDEPGCDRMFRTTPLMIKHNKSVHLKVKNYKCDRANCEKAFSENSMLLRHIKITHEKHREKCPVEDCKFTKGRRDYMKNHIRKHVELKPELQTKMIESLKEMELCY